MRAEILTILIAGFLFIAGIGFGEIIFKPRKSTPTTMSALDSLDREWLDVFRELAKKCKCNY